MKKVLQRTIFLFSLLLSLNSLASHIVGGEINYTYLGSNQYQIDITMFRDCNSTTDFDDPAAIGIFDLNGNLVNTIDINLGAVNTVNASINNPCITPPSSVCTEVTTYSTVVTLPPNGTGYQVVYQRCCRNSVVTNIFDPGNTGATYVAYIPGVAPLNANDNPVFTSYPPLFICAGTPFTFNHSATDADGDSLVYSLTTPYEGATAGNPQPATPSSPPYTNITWQNPYSQNDMFGGVPLAIDAQTGVLTCTPNTIGTFVYAVQVAEYRNGVLLGYTRREYQLTVTNCNNPTVAGFGLANASGGVGYSTCSSTVVFNNTSSNATSYSWNFGDPTTTADVSTQTNPSYTYPTPGTYNVTLIATSVNCSDTLNIPVTITGNINVLAGQNQTACPGNSVNLSASGATSYSWSPSTGLSNSTIANPVATPSVTTTYVVTGTDGSGCTGTDTVVVTIGTITVSAGLDQTVCNGSCVTLNASGATTYSWSPAAGLTGANTATPNACPVVTTTYVVTGSSNGCTDTDTVTVFVTTPPNVTAGNDTTICPGGTAQLFATGGLAYSWSPTNGLSNPSSSNPTANPTTTTTYTVTVTAPSGNLVVNGDFSAGNSGFTSGYVNNNNLQPEGRYDITNDASNNHPNFVGVDHTTGSGQFMAVNGSGTPNTDVWCQTVNVTPNTTYAFSTWVSTLAPGNPAALQFGINGTQLGSVFNAPSTTGTWSQFF
ncbi:MAG: PKD domain-containing protein, partial [Bacteroidia bacterium]|nr:PKD domain-containing protein [Bacteroidia bacterium]